MKKQELNASRVIMLGHYKAVYDIECADKKQGIWRGIPVPDIRDRKEKEKVIYFSRKYDTVNNDMDKILPELSFITSSTKDILGVDFWLIPNDKILFGWEPPPKDGIILPPKVFGRKGRGEN